MGIFAMKVTFVVLLIGGATACWAQEDVVTIEGTRIQGDEELPALVFDLPWQVAQFPLLDRRDERLMTRRAVTGLERPVVRRELELHQRLLDLTNQQEPSDP